MSAVGESSGNYVFDQTPEIYGNNQAYYTEQVDRVVAEACDTIHKAVRERKNLQDLFHTLLDTFAIERQKIAKETKSEDVEQFGVRRDSEVGVGEGHSYTGLAACYAKYGVKFEELLLSILSKMPHDTKDFSTKPYKEESVFAGRVSSLEVQVFNAAELAKKQWLILPNVEKIRKIIAPEKTSFAKWKRLKRLDPALYVHDKMHFFITALKNSYPEPKIVRPVGGTPYYEGNTDNLKSHWVLATAKLQINGKMVELTQFLTFLYCNGKVDPVERMKGRTVILAIHQDFFLIEDTLKAIAKVFEKVIMLNAKRDGFPALIENVGVIRFVFASCMPFLRGSAAVGEIYEKSIYKFHGKQMVPWPKDKACDLEAMTARSLGEFMKVYVENTVLVDKES